MNMGMGNIINKKKWLIIFVILLLCGSVIVMINNDTEYEDVSYEIRDDYRLLTIDNHRYKFNSDLEMILFLGIDKYENHELGQSDTIQLLILDQQQKNMKILSLSRDIMADIRIFSASGEDLGWKQQHLGLAYSYGKTSDHGCTLALDAISRMFGNIPIINYAAMNMNSIDELQSIIGTLSIHLTQDYTDLNPQWKQYKTIHLKPKEAETFLRRRDTEKDFSNTLRMKRQQEYIKVYIQKLKKMLEKDFQQVINKLYEFYKNASTNISIEDISNYAEMIMTYHIDYDQSFYTLQGQETVGKYHDEVYIDEGQLEDIKIQLFYKEENKK